MSNDLQKDTLEDRQLASDRRLLADLGFKDDYSGIYVAIFQSREEIGTKGFRPLTLQNPTDDFERKI